MLQTDFIAIEGTIGAGKSTLAKLLAGELKSALLLENFDDNSYLPKFYEDPEHYALPLELSFLLARHEQLAQQVAISGIVDLRCVSDYYFHKSFIFAKINLPVEEYLLFKKVAALLTDRLPVPDLLVYLHRPVDVLKGNILKRGRVYEQNITEHYLSLIQDNYLLHFKTLTKQRVLILYIDKLDFEGKTQDYKKIRSVINNPYPIGITELIL